MIKPQTKALNIGQSGCLAMCDLYLTGLSGEEAGNALWNNYDDLVSKKIIGEDCFLLDHQKFLKYFGCDKEYVRTRNFDDIPEGQLYIANYVKGKYNHFVVKQNGAVVFNSIEHSACVDAGNTDGEYRFLK